MHALVTAALLCLMQPAAPQDPMAWWREARFGMFIHWGLYSEAGGVWNGKFLPGWSEWMLNRLKIPPAEYQAELLPRFDPVDFDAAAWVRAARDAGMGYMVITAKHHEGFAIWASEAGTVDVEATRFGKAPSQGGRGRDPLKELAGAAAADGMPLGFYYSLLDWSHPDYLPRRPWESRPADGADYSRYAEYMSAQVRELLGGKYGAVRILWGDGDWEHSMAEHRSDAVVAMARQLQPGILVNDRWAQPGDYATPENRIPDARMDRPWETCMTLNESWGYARDDKAFKPASEVTRMLVDCVSKGGNFLLNVGPTGRGTIDGTTLGILREVGAWMRMYGQGIRGCGSAPLPQPEWGRWTWRADSTGRTLGYAHVSATAAAGTDLRMPGVLSMPASVRVLGDAAVGAPRPPAGDPQPVIAERDGADVLLRIVEPVAPVLGSTIIEVAWDAPPRIATPPAIVGDERIFIDKAKVQFSAPSDECTIHATTDGSVPSPASPRVGAGRAGMLSLPIDRTCDVRAITAWNGQVVGHETTARFTRVEPLVPIARGESRPGLEVRLVEGTFDKVPAREAFGEGSSAWRADVPDVRLPSDRPPESFAVRLSGFVDAPQTGIYRFGLSSDDGSVLEIDSTVVVDHDGPHGATERTGDIALGAGRHRISIRFFEATGSESLSLRWRVPGTDTLVPVPASRLSH